MINIKDFDPNLIKIDKKSYENIGIYYIGYITMKSISDYKSTYSVNRQYLITVEVYGHIEESDGNMNFCFY